MPEITHILTDKGHIKRVRVFVDGKYAFSLSQAVAAEEGLYTGMELPASRMEELARTDSHRRCLDAAARFLSYRPRSEAELAERLRRRGFTDDTVQAVLLHLREGGYVDDVAFARFWQDNRASFRPCSRRVTVLELRKKGVAEETIDQVTAAVDDAAGAYRAALSKAGHLPLTDYRGFRNKLSGYLRRRGFSHDVVDQTTRRLWEEMKYPDNQSSNSMQVH